MEKAPASRLGLGQLLSGLPDEFSDRLGEAAGLFLRPFGVFRLNQDVITLRDGAFRAASASFFLLHASL